MRRHRRKEKERFYTDIRVAGRLPVLIRKPIQRKVIQSLSWCCDKRGLRIFEYCILPDRLVLIGDAVWGHYPDLIGSFVRFTSGQIARLLREGRRGAEDAWMLRVLSEQGIRDVPEGERFWQEPILETLREGEQIDRCAISLRKLPVQTGLVSRPEHWLISSAHPLHPLEGWIVECVDPWV